MTSLQLLLDNPLYLYGSMGVAAVVFLALLIFLKIRRTPSVKPAAGLKKEKPLKDRLDKPRHGWIARLGQVLSAGSQIDDGLYDQLEEVLITSDMGTQTTAALLNRVRGEVGRQNLKNPIALKDQLRQEILQTLQKVAPGNGSPHSLDASQKPLVLLVVGVNGVGKTTTIGKLALRFTQAGKKVLLAAGDTFRAAAVEQLKIWGERSGCDVIAHEGGKDPAAVAFDAIEAARARQVDLLIVDTAGRLETKVNLMEELKKVCRTLDNCVPGAPHEIWLVLDATTGQNAFQQARIFHEELGGITGLVLTKLDGTAKGGVIVGLSAELAIPIQFIGVGEKPEDLRPFDAQNYVSALFTD